MSHRNDNLSFRAGGTIHRGRAVKLQSDGTVVEITDNKDLVVGWAVNDAHPGHPVSVTTMFKGILRVELDRSAGTYYAGAWLTLADDGRMKRWFNNVEDARMGVVINNMKKDDGIYADALILRHINRWDRPDP